MNQIWRMGRVVGLAASLCLLSACERARQEQSEPVSRPAPVVEVTPAATEPPADPMVLLGRQLHDPDPVRRREAANRMGELAQAGELTDGPLQQLINAVDMEEDGDVVAAVIRALGHSCHPAALDVLVRNLRGDPSKVRAETVQVLGDIGNFPVAEELDAFTLKIAEDDSPVMQALLLQAEESRKRIMQRAGRRAGCPVPPPAS